MSWHKQHTSQLSSIERIEEAISRFCGTRTFLLVHVVWFAFWISLPVEAFPYGLLTMIVSLEAIILSTIIMINQRRHDKLAQAQSEYDRRIEITKLDELLRRTRDIRTAFEWTATKLDTAERFNLLCESTRDEALRATAMAAALFAKHPPKQIHGKRTHKG